MNLILFDDCSRDQLLPFTHTKPVSEIRCGIFTSRERWEKLFNCTAGTLTEAYLQKQFPTRYNADILYINSGIIATPQLSGKVRQLRPGEALFQNNILIAASSTESFDTYSGLKEFADSGKKTQESEPLLKIEKLWHIFELNDKAIAIDYQFLTDNRESEPLPNFVTAISPEKIFIEKGATVYPSTLNASTGYIYIGKDAEVMEGCMVRGPFAIAEHAVLKMGAKVYGATTIGPGCKVGGEVGNVVFFNNSNKGHDGFLGNSVIGEWCNFGADTNCSNLKNNYAEVSIWNEHEGKPEKTGSQFCGLFMGDHSKCGINTMFNTGTVVGVSCNIFGGNFPDKFMPSFTWGGTEETATYKFEKALETAERMMERRKKALSQTEKDILRYIFEHTAKLRN